jgi:hypothetical protein
VCVCVCVCAIAFRTSEVFTHWLSLSELMGVAA